MSSLGAPAIWTPDLEFRVFWNELGKKYPKTTKGLKIFESARYSKGHGTLESYGIWKAEKSINAEWVLFLWDAAAQGKETNLEHSNTHHSWQQSFSLLFFFPLFPILIFGSILYSSLVISDNIMYVY